MKINQKLNLGVFILLIVFVSILNSSNYHDNCMDSCMEQYGKKYMNINDAYDFCEKACEDESPAQETEIEEQEDQGIDYEDNPKESYVESYENYKNIITKLQDFYSNLFVYIQTANSYISEKETSVGEAISNYYDGEDKELLLEDVSALDSEEIQQLISKFDEEDEVILKKSDEKTRREVITNIKKDIKKKITIKRGVKKANEFLKLKETGGKGYEFEASSLKGIEMAVRTGVGTISGVTKVANLVARVSVSDTLVKSGAGSLLRGHQGAVDSMPIKYGYEPQRFIYKLREEGKAEIEENGMGYYVEINGKKHFVSEWVNAKDKDGNEYWVPSTSPESNTNVDELAKKAPFVIKRVKGWGITKLWKNDNIIIIDPKTGKPISKEIDLPG